MKKNGYKLRMSSEWFIFNSFRKVQAIPFAFMARSFVR